MFSVLLVTICKGEREEERHIKREKERPSFAPFALPSFLPQVVWERQVNMPLNSQKHTHTFTVTPPRFIFLQQISRGLQEWLCCCVPGGWNAPIRRVEVLELPVLCTPGEPPKPLTSLFFSISLNIPSYIFFSVSLPTFSTFSLAFSLVTQGLSLISLIPEFSYLII